MVQASGRSRTGSRSPRWSCPTGTRRSEHANRTAFDVGEWGLGFMTTSLELGCDCLGEITYVDAVLHDSAGEPQVIGNAICLHEEDDGVGWKHVDGVVGAEVRRRRRMVVSSHVTVANYEYLVYWRFYEDGTIECEVRATGIMVTTPFPEGEPPPYGTVVDARTYAPIHQHFIVARLDMDVDGEPNTVVATETVQPPIGPDNPYGLALDPGERAAHHRGRVRPELGHPARLEGHQQHPAQRPRHPDGVQARAERSLPGDARPVVAGVRARPGHRAHAVGHAVPSRRALAVRGVRQPVRVRRGPRGVDAGPAVDPTTPTSCSGTSSASTTCRAWRTGP